ncbi:MAG TPA: ABC transporter substrate-binding protein [Streptosporangiaceae bacterium]|nr:ABC transporter substrate-binding protein [Streptosporangiaceae bacterium]
MLIIGGVVAMLAGACSSGSGSGSPSSTPTSTAASGSSSGALEKTTITVGTLPVVDVAPLFLAIKNGYFAQQGLTVKTVLAQQSTATLPDLLHGVVDIITGNYTTYFLGDARHTFSLDVVGMGFTCVPDTFEILALPGSGITKPADLAGKTVAVNVVNNIQTLATNAILKADGVTGKPVYVPIPFPDMIAALKAHRVDAISVVEPFISGAKHSAGAVTVMSECQGPTANIPVSGYYTTAAFAQQYPNTARAFQRAMARAQAYANANPQAVKAIIPSFVKITPAAADAVALGIFPPSIDTSALQKLADLMFSNGMLASPFQVSSIVFK